MNRVRIPKAIFLKANAEVNQQFYENLERSPTLIKTTHLDWVEHRFMKGSSHYMKHHYYYLKSQSNEAH